MDIDVLIAKYLNGESTAEEAGFISEWRRASAENELIFRQSEDAWRLVNSPKIGDFDQKKTWVRIQSRTKRQYSLLALLGVAGVAASVALVLGLAFSYLVANSDQETVIKPQLITLYVPAGVCSKTVLPDGTVIWLNASSKLIYPSYFDGDTRSIELTGEAFFDVTEDKTKPFIIHSGNLRVNVLGTSFNFKYYKEDTHAIIAVETGMVTVTTGASSVTTLPAGKYAKVDRQTLKTQVFEKPQAHLEMKTSSNSGSVMIDKKTVTDQFSSWRNYKMVYRDEPFGNVLNDLARRYNVEFVIQGDEIREYVYTATFDDLSFEDVLKLLKLSSPIDYSIQNINYNNMNAYEKRKVTIFRK